MALETCSDEGVEKDYQEDRQEDPQRHSLDMALAKFRLLRSRWGYRSNARANQGAPYRHSQWQRRASLSKRNPTRSEGAEIDQDPDVNHADQSAESCSTHQTSSQTRHVCVS